MVMTPLHVRDVCSGRAGNSSAFAPYNPTGICKYLTGSHIGSKFVYLCVKKAPALIPELRKTGQLRADFDKLGDNCPGYRYLKHKAQGYDRDH